MANFVWPALQIGVQTQYKNGSGAVNLFFGNKSDSTMERLICAVPPCAEFNISVSPVPPSLAPKVQMQVLKDDLFDCMCQNMAILVAERLQA